MSRLVTLLAAGLALVASVCVLLVVLVRFCGGCAPLATLLTLGLIGLAAVAVAVGPVRVIMGSFHFELPDDEEEQMRFADKGAPPWAKQYDPPQDRPARRAVDPRAIKVTRNSPGVIWLKRTGCVAGGLLCLGFAALYSSGETRIVSGTPIEVRARSARVVMADGQSYGYRCWKDRGRSSGTCQGELEWAKLPRWPKPQHVRMEVADHEIRALDMDGVRIVDSAEFRTGDRISRVGSLILGLLFLAGAMMPKRAYLMSDNRRQRAMFRFARVRSRKARQAKAAGTARGLRFSRS